MFRLDSPIETARLRLRPFEPRDLDDLHAIQSLPEVVRYLYWDVRTRDDVRTVLDARRAMTQLAQNGDIVVLAVERKDTGSVIGDVNLKLVSTEHAQGEFGFVLHPDHQGMGYAGEAAAAVLDLAFGPVGLHRVIGRTDARNVASAALMRKLGLREEAHFVENEIFKGEWGEELVFAILDREWAARLLPG
jgi:RimJ/RimL family protein N-acetyltransferase